MAAAQRSAAQLPANPTPTLSDPGETVDKATRSLELSCSTVSCSGHVGRLVSSVWELELAGGVPGGGLVLLCRLVGSPVLLSELVRDFPSGNKVRRQRGAELYESPNLERDK